MYLCCPSEASTRYCVIPGGYPPQDWQSLPCAGEELDSNPGLLICSQVRYHWATSPPHHWATSPPPPLEILWVLLWSLLGCVTAVRTVLKVTVFWISCESLLSYIIDPVQEPKVKAYWVLLQVCCANYTESLASYVSSVRAIAKGWRRVNLLLEL